MIAAQLFRGGEERLSKQTHTTGDLPPDYEIEDLHQLTRIVEFNLHPQKYIP
jgi:hypothetical protein